MKPATIMALLLALCSCSTVKHNSKPVDDAIDNSPQVTVTYELPEKAKKDPHQVYLDQYHRYYQEYKKKGYTDEQAQRAASVDSYYGNDIPPELTPAQKK